MKIGFTDINRNVYGLKKKNRIGFGQSNSISQKTTVVQNNSDDKKKSDKLNTAGKFALAITIPTVMVGSALAAYYITKGKKKNVNGSKIAPKIEKEIEQKITKNDLLKDTEKVSKILKSLASSPRGQKIFLTKSDAQKTYATLTNFEGTVRKIFDKKISNNICSHLCQLEDMFSKFLASNKDDFKVDENLKQESQLALKDINNFMKILKKYDNIESVKNALQKMSKTKNKNREIIPEIKREHAASLQKDTQILANVINNSEKFEYDFSGKNINNAKFVLNSQNKKYLIFDKTSDIIPKETKKKQSGFIVDGSGDTRFFAIALDGVSADNLLGMIKNENVLKQLDSVDASLEAQDLLFNTLKNIEPEKMLEAIENNNTLSSTQLLTKYTEQKINITEENIDTTVEEIVQNKDQKLALLLSSEKAVQNIMTKIISHLEYNPIDEHSIKASLTQTLINNIEQSKFKDNYLNVIHQLKNINAIRDLKASAPKELLDKYKVLFDLNKDQLSNVYGDQKLVIFNDGHVEAISENDIENNVLTDPDALFTIQSAGRETSIENLKEPEIIYQAGNIINDTEINQKLVFKYNYNNAIDQIKCFFELSDIFDIAIVKPILYEMKEALSIPIRDEKQNESSTKLIENTKQKVEELLTNFDSRNYNKAQALNDLCDTNLDSLNIKLDYDQTALNELLDKKHLMDNNTAKSFMDKFVLAKFGPNFVKPVYKEIVRLDGQKMNDIGFDIQDISDDVKKQQKQTSRYSLNSAYKYALSDGSSYNIETFDKSSGNGKGYRITSSKNEGLNMETPQELSNLVKDISNDPILETLFVYNLDTPNEKPNEKQNYFKAKIANALKSDNWADDVQNIIHTMYSLDLLSKNRSASNGEGTITGAYEIYEDFLNNSTPNILYITQNGDVLVNPNEQTKPKCYVLALG